MAQEKPRANDRAYQFILNNIDSVPELEGLILLWQSRPREWTPEDLAVRLYVSADRARRVLRDLDRIGMVVAGTDDQKQYGYSSSPERDELMAEVHATYRLDLIRVSHMIHSKTSPAVREFARAFRFKREQDS